METLVMIISLLFVAAVIASPIVILIALKRRHVSKYRFLAYLVLGVVTTAVILFAFAWWSHVSAEMLLSYYGYDFDKMNDTGKFSGVAAANLERVKSLEISIGGIGWPLKAIMAFTVYLPYILLIYVVIYLAQKIKTGMTQARTPR